MGNRSGVTDISRPTNAVVSSVWTYSGVCAHWSSSGGWKVVGRGRLSSHPGATRRWGVHGPSRLSQVLRAVSAPYLIGDGVSGPGRRE